MILLQNHLSAFAWGYEDMKGIPPEIVYIISIFRKEPNLFEKPKGE